MHTDKTFLISSLRLPSVFASASCTRARGTPVAKAAALAASPDCFKKVRRSIKEGAEIFSFMCGCRLMVRRLVSIIVFSLESG